jgi:hypothetical protein
MTQPIFRSNECFFACSQNVDSGFCSYREVRRRGFALDTEKA